MRHYKRKFGSRPYASTYTEAALTKAVRSYKAGTMSMRKAATKYGIPFGTLNNKCHGKCVNRVGAPLRLSPQCEQRLLTTIDHLAEWKVPMDGMDIRLLVKEYLDRSGISDARFKNNCPGPDWLKSFVARHRLTQRLADNVKPARAEINRDSVNLYFDELEKALAAAPAENIYNFDETNITDNPGVKTVVCRRGLKRVERKMQHSKSSISLMYCGSASGVFLPPMVVYRAANCYTEWTLGGPAGSLYDCSKSGWFDARCFARWFTEVFVEHVQHQNGIKVLLGDNLASHFTLEVIEQCVTYNIRFVCLLPNATHLLQPLDVAVFRPLKIEWRKILESWHKESRVKGSIPKNQFPGLLKKLQNQLKEENICSGFRAAGIFPTDRQMVLKRLPNHNQDTGANVTEVFNEAISGMLKKHCGYGEKSEMKRGKKITPGRPVLPADLRDSASGPTTSSSPGPSGVQKRPRPRQIISSSEDSNSDVEPSSDESSSEDVGLNTSTGIQSKTTAKSVSSGQWVSVGYPGSKKNTTVKYIGQVVEVTATEKRTILKIKFVRRQLGGSAFKFPPKDDIDSNVNLSDVVEFLDKPSMNNRLQYMFPNVNPVLYG